MELFPALRLGWLNGWLFLPFAYLSTEGLAKSLPKDVSPRLFEHGGWTRRDETIALLAGVPTLAYFVLLILTPLRIGSWLLPIGTAVFVVGSGACVHSIWMFAKTAEGEPVMRGLYRISRNPQTVGMFIAIIGASLAIGSWIALMVVVVWGVFLHARVLAEEKTCLADYGEAYRQFMVRVPRYLFF
jgi:protein-S-isoprenylcysteine O-methyltransferase Ste14